MTDKASIDSSLTLESKSVLGKRKLIDTKLDYVHRKMCLAELVGRLNEMQSLQKILRKNETLLESKIAVLKKQEDQTHDEWVVLKVYDEKLDLTKSTDEHFIFKIRVTIPCIGSLVRHAAFWPVKTTFAENVAFHITKDDDTTVDDTTELLDVLNMNRIWRIIQPYVPEMPGDASVTLWAQVPVCCLTYPSLFQQTE